MSTASTSSLTTPQPEAVATPSQHVVDPKRERKQLSILAAGCGFAILSGLITRRAVLRRIKWAKPTYFRQNDGHPEHKFDAGLEAFEAFSVATVNVFSWSLVIAGGTMWATDTSGIHEAREKLRVRLGMNENEQKGSQAIVGQWLEAAKFWKTSKPLVEPAAIESAQPSIPEPSEQKHALEKPLLLDTSRREG
jgi:hypothetical protein